MSYASASVGLLAVESYYKRDDKLVKNTKSICIRAIILLCFSDRCALEKSNINGKMYSLNEREDQRKAIFSWLGNQGYTEFLTASERELFEKEVGRGDSKGIISKQIRYEAIEPCLWAVGLRETLSGFDQFVQDDFHPVLEIGRNHSINSLVSKLSLKSISDLALQREIAMLWNWRAREANSSIFTEEKAKDIIISTFGNEYEQIVQHIQSLKQGQEDFIVGSKQFNKLSIEEMRKVAMISMWRQHAFEWITSEDEWDEIDTST